MTQTSGPGPTWYDILGVAHDASPAEIKAAWRSMTDKFEPGSGTSQFRLFNEAADVLLDPDRRAAYDAELAGAPADPELDATSTETTPAPEVAPVESPPSQQEAVETDDDEPDAEDASPVDTTPHEEPSADRSPEDQAGRGGPLAVLGGLNDYVVAAIAVLALASIVLAVILGLHVQDRVEVADAEPSASATAERALKAVLSYDYRHMEADRDRAVKFLTPSYKKEYLKTFDELLSTGPDGAPGPAVKTKAVVTADVLDTGVADAEKDRVRVVVFVNQSSVKGDADPVIFQNRVVATLVRQGGDWLVDNIKSY